MADAVMNGRTRYGLSFPVLAGSTVAVGALWGTTCGWGDTKDSKFVDYIPDDKLNWSPKEGLWNYRGILIHIASARDNWLGHTVNDGVEVADVWQTVRTKAEVQAAYARTWDRVATFLGDAAKLDATYEDEPVPVTGHWIAFHLLEHDVHHRADIFHYLALLGIETPDVGTP